MSDTNKLILICVETTRQANTDVSYIDKVLKYFYNIKNDEKLKYLYLETKTKYNDTYIQKKIEQAIKPWQSHEIILCLDVDDASRNSETFEYNKRIETFCKSKGYRLVWFCENIEEVFWHKKIDKSKKIIEAKKFGRIKDIGVATEDSLSNDALHNMTSNMLIVFDEILERM